MCSGNAVRSAGPEAYFLFVRREEWATENAAEGHFQQPSIAEVAELADALDSGSSALTGVRVQIPASAPPVSMCQDFSDLTTSRLTTCY